MSIIKKISRCRFCDSEFKSPFLFFYNIPIASVYLKEDEFGTEPYADLSISECSNCGLVQLLESVSPEIYTEYKFCGTYSASFVQHINKYVNMIEEISDNRGSVLEIGVNNGYLLNQLNNLGYNTLGFDPARELTTEKQKKKLNIVPEYFNLEISKKYKMFNADFVIIRHVIEHIENLHDLFQGIDNILSKDGWLILEVPDLNDILKNQVFTNFFHEHLYYFNINTIDMILKKYGFKIVKADYLPIHSGSLRVLCKRKENVEIEMIKIDKLLYNNNYYEDINRIKSTADKFIKSFKNKIENLIFAKKTIAGYGGGQRTNTFLGMTKVSLPDDMFLVDKNEQYHNYYTPHNHLPILPVDNLLKKQPDYTFLFARSFEQEIFEEQKQYIQNGGKMLSTKDYNFPELKLS